MHVRPTTLHSSLGARVAREQAHDQLWERSRDDTVLCAGRRDVTRGRSGIGMHGGAQGASISSLCLIFLGFGFEVLLAELCLG